MRASRGEPPAKPEGESCPVCGRDGLKSLSHHVNYLVSRGDSAHTQFKLTGGSKSPAEVLSAEPEKVKPFSGGAGDALVGILLSFALQRNPALLIPAGWRPRCAEAYQLVLENHVGPWVGEKSDIVGAVLITAELVGVNLVAPKLEGVIDPPTGSLFPSAEKPPEDAPAAA